MVRLRNICINTLHKGDNDEDNNDNKPTATKVAEERDRSNENSDTRQANGRIT